MLNSQAKFKILSKACLCALTFYSMSAKAETSNVLNFNFPDGALSGATFNSGTTSPGESEEDGSAILSSDFNYVNTHQINVYSGRHGTTSVLTALNDYNHGPLSASDPGAFNENSNSLINGEPSKLNLVIYVDLEIEYGDGTHWNCNDIAFAQEGVSDVSSKNEMSAEKEAIKMIQPSTECLTNLGDDEPSASCIKAVVDLADEAYNGAKLAWEVAHDKNPWWVTQIPPPGTSASINNILAANASLMESPNPYPANMIYCTNSDNSNQGAYAIFEQDDDDTFTVSISPLSSNYEGS